MSVRLHGACKYTNDGCRCNVCRGAQAQRVGRRRDERRQWLVMDDEGRLVSTADVAHGSTSTYNNWLCRCAPCSRVQAADQRQRRRGATP